MRAFFKNMFQRLHREQRRACSLKELPEGRRAKILDMLCSDDQRRRLCALGLTPGTSVETRNQFPGVCRLLVRGAALALDGELAKQVLCEEE
ncbi:MAG: ferrous iron transport protein A [Deltaproteobacteria bacterium]|jgi:ferrous iron transport protein A|nr:ferrous iron transport protein A [Deltaproteobacteria bacterium]